MNPRSGIPVRASRRTRTPPVQIGPAVRAVRARVATDEERDRLWPKFVAFYPGYEFFQRNARRRKIPIVILDPR